MTPRRRGAGLLTLVSVAASVLLVAAAVTPADAATAAASASGLASATHRWSPVPGQPWQWILDGPLTTAEGQLDVPTFDIDGFENSAATVTALHRAGRHVICYIDVGTWESFRPDAARFPRSVLGRPNGWPGERWLDIRRLSVLEPLMTARLRMCAAKGFDAVEPDNIDGYANDTGFPITARQQLRYDTWVAEEVHHLGMSVALKNDLGQVPQLVGLFDFALDEQCYQYQECSSLVPFSKRHKAVLEVEYSEKPAVFCPVTQRRFGFASMLKHLSLDAYRVPCPG